MIFFPQKLDQEHTFSFAQPFEEKNIITADGTMLSGLIFKANESKGLIFYLHGNAGCLETWGKVAKTYTDLQYDVFMLDYRGFGKSEGSIRSEHQIHEDIQTAYNLMLQDYQQDRVIVLGYSLGSGLASRLASNNTPKLLILQAPYYSLTDMMRKKYPIIPTFLLKYTFETYAYLPNCSMPVAIFHGTDDTVIPYDCSVRLESRIRNTGVFVTLENQGHNGMTDNPQYQKELKQILLDHEVDKRSNSTSNL